jgi:ribosomal protein S18 acetylase RimI-like enzyme
MREVRLAALLDAPSAFASTYRREVAFGAADWLLRLTRGATFLARDSALGGRPVGIAGGTAVGAERPGAVELVSMWVDPRVRRRGVGVSLVDAVVAWSRETEADRVHLWVTESNAAGRALYARYGFTPTGERKPLPSDPALHEIGMALAVSPA